MWQPGSAYTVCPSPPLILAFDRLNPFDLETGTPVASKVENLPSKFGHARPLDSRIICYVRDRRTDRQADGRTDGQKQRLLVIAPFLRAGA